MPALTLTPTLRRGLPWLLWLALLLPLAQTAAAWHAYSHVREVVRLHEVDAQAPHAALCDLCLTAAAAGGGALPGSPPALTFAVIGHDLPQPAAVGVWQAPVSRAYRSRAPPAPR